MNLEPEISIFVLIHPLIDTGKFANAKFEWGF
jgi:hypothetical protein